LVGLVLLLKKTKAKTQTAIIKTTEQPIPAEIPAAFLFFPAIATAYTNS
jgi:hypothetical protein